MKTTYSDAGTTPSTMENLNKPTDKKTKKTSNTNIKGYKKTTQHHKLTQQKNQHIRYDNVWHNILVVH